MGRIIGIDLGTTNSLVSYWENNAVHLIPNAFGEYLTPSIVSIDMKQTVYVGKVAKERLITHPEETISVFKRSMGTGKRWQLSGTSFSPEELSAMVLRRLKEDAETYFGESVEEAVISVPAYFGDKARKATRDAGRLAGLKVERILNEPSAAALACIQMQGVQQATYLVFDFGGGTLDVSLVQCYDNIIEVKAVSGNNHLGGSDFDQAIARGFCRKNGLDFAHLDASMQYNLLRSAEQVKIALTGAESALMVVTTPQEQKSMEITRREMIGLIAPALQRLAQPINNVLRDAGVVPQQLDAVIMVGGSSKMPVVQQYLRFVMKKVKLQVVNPDLMVGLGVGIYAGIKERSSDIRDVVMTDLCPFSLGTDVRNEAELDKPLMSVIIPRNTMLPATREQHYTNAHDNQTRSIISVYQGEGMYAKDNAKLGSITVKYPPAAKESEKISVRFTYDINGLLIVRVKVRSTQEEKEITIFDGKETQDEEILKRAKWLSQLTMSEAQEEENRLLIERGERLFTQVSGENKEYIKACIQQFRAALASGDKIEIQKKKKLLKEVLDQIEAVFVDTLVEEAGAEEFQAWLDELEERENDDWGSIWHSGDFSD